MNASGSHRSGRVRSRVIGGAVLVAVVFWIGTLFRGPGQGGGDGEGPSVEEGRPAATEDVAVNLQNADPVSTPEPETGGGAPEIVPVLLYEDGYRLPRDPWANAADVSEATSDDFDPATLDQALARARDATGNKSGIKVLLLQHASSQVGAKNALLKALQDAGIGENEIHVRQGYVD
jgi:hypothetical protein